MKKINHCNPCLPQAGKLISVIRNCFNLSFIKQFQKRKGFSLLELSAMLLILAIAVPPMLAAFNYVMRSTALEEITTVSNFLAQEIMEQVLSMDFFDMETRDTADWSDFDAPFSANYEYFINTEYIDPESGDATTPFSLLSGRGNYLRITVRVRHNLFTDKVIELQTITTPSADRSYYQ